MLLLFSCNIKKEHAEIIYINAKVYTVDDKGTIADCFVIENDKFIAVGTKHEILKKYTASKIIDLKGKYVFPGLIDGHCHFLHYGLNFQYADLSGAGSMEEVIAILQEFQKQNPSNWILGKGWNQNKWKDKTMPENKKLDEAFQYFPVAITRIDGHAILANSLALKRAGITKDKIIEGGKIIIKDDKMTGLLMDKAADIMSERAFRYNSRQAVKALLNAQKSCFAVGLTTVADAGLEKRDIDIIDTLQTKGKLLIRVYAMLSSDDNNLKYYINTGTYKTPYLDVRSIKIYADGSLGSRGALLLKPYADDPGNYGLMLTKTEEIKRICKLAYEKGFQVNTHAIGDSAVRMVLKIYSEILKDFNGRRWRIEHSQVVDPLDMPLFKKFSIIPSVQTCHAVSDMDWAIERLGPVRIKYAYAYKDLLTQNEWIINGTDFPVESINPLFNFYTAITRKDINNNPVGGFQPENKLTREQALKAMTIWAAKGCLEDREKGSIEPGKLADFIVTDKDFMTILENEIPSVKVLQTYIGAKKVFDGE